LSGEKRSKKNRTKLEAKIRKVLEYIDEGIACDNLPDNEPPMPVNPEELKKRIAEINRENCTKAEQNEINKLKNKYLQKLEEYERHLKTMDNRNNYSSTNPSATMYLKDDHM
jgi:response regulator RpfG family c-di-GMP phosphodiesterase